MVSLDTFTTLNLHALTVTLPPYCQSPSPALKGSTLGPPISPVFGFSSPSKSFFGPRLKSRCCSSSAGAVTAGEAPIDWLALRRASNSAWSEGGRGGGEGRSKVLREARRVGKVVNVRVKGVRRLRRDEEGMRWASIVRVPIM